MAATFSDCWREVRLRCSAAPVFLCRSWVNESWKALTRTRPWSFLRGELDISTNAARTLNTVTATTGTALILSSAEFLPSDAGRQISIGSPRIPIFTIQTVQDASTALLDRIWGGPPVGPTMALIADCYFVAPLDFASFRIIADPYYFRRLAFWITEDQLNILDPVRQASDSGPRALAAHAFSTYVPTLGQVRYEYWPRPTAQKSFPALYNKQARELTDTDTLTGVMADGQDALVKGALWQAAEWPGSPDLPNPYFNLQLADRKHQEFLDAVQHLALKDDAHYMDDMGTVHWEHWPLADIAFNDHSLRATDATILDLY